MEKKFESSPLWWWLFVSISLLLIAIIAFIPGLNIDPTYIPAARVLLYVILGLHVMEAILAYWIASSNGLKEVAMKWSLHTLVCGFMALQRLQKIIHERKAPL